MRFSRDRRGQSVVVGTVILFGFLILAISLYQVQVVPQENAQVEFEHFQEVRNDLVDLRAGILQAGSTDRTQYQTVRLGTSYSPRLFAINPPSPTGTIQTRGPYPITIAYSNGTVIETIPTRFIEYRPGYNEIDRSPTWYDASVLYTDASDHGGGIAVIEGQELVDNDENVNVVAVQNEFRRSGTGRVTVELQPAESVTGDIPDGNLTVTVPTRLSEDDWESKTNITEKDAYNEVTGGGNGIYNLTLDTTAENLTVDTVGVQEAPEEPTQNDNGAVDRGSEDGSGDSTEASQVIYVDGTGSAARVGGESRVDLDIQNTGDSNAAITGISVDSDSGSLSQLYEQGGGSGAGQHEVYIDSSIPGLLEQGGSAGDGNEGNTPYQLGTQETLTEQATLDANEQTTVTLLNFRNNGGNIKSAADKPISVTLYFRDGSSTSFTFTPPGY